MSSAWRVMATTFTLSTLIKITNVNSSAAGANPAPRLNAAISSSVARRTSNTESAEQTGTPSEVISDKSKRKSGTAHMPRANSMLCA